MTQRQFDYYNSLAAKMDRIAKQRGRDYTDTSDLTAEERTAYRRLQVLADAEQAPYDPGAFPAPSA